jgi:hypothetical protein
MMRQILSILLILLIAFSAVGVALADAPEFDTIGDQTFNEAELNTLSIAPSDADGDTLTITLIEDSYTSEDSSYSESDDFEYIVDAGDYSSALQWTPDYADVGDHTFTYTVTDDTGEETSETFTITVISQYVVALEEFTEEYDELIDEFDDIVDDYQDAIADSPEDLEEIGVRIDAIVGDLGELFINLLSLNYDLDDANDDEEISDDLTAELESQIEDLIQDIISTLEELEEMQAYIESYQNNVLPIFVPLDGMEFIFNEDTAGIAVLLIEDSDAGESYTLSGVEDSFTSESSSLDLTDSDILQMLESEAFYEANIYWTPTNDDVGYHYLTITATDGYGNEVSVSVVLNVIGENDFPQIPAIADQTVSVDSTTGTVEVFTYDLAATDEDSESLTYVVSATLDPSAADPTALPTPINDFEVDADGVLTWTPDLSESGLTFNVIVTVMDFEGGMDTAEFDIQVIENAIPVISTLDSTYSATEGEEFTLTFTATEADGESLTFEINEDSFSGTYASSSNIESEATFTDNSDDTYTLAWTPTNDAVGTITASITATDDSGSQTVSDQFTITVADVNSAPVIDTIADQTVDTGDTLDLTIIATDGDGDSITLSMSGDLPSDATFTDNTDGTATLTWTTVAGDDEEYDVTITATDSEGESSTEEFIVTVGEGSPLSAWEQAIQDLQDEFDEIESNYHDDDLEDEYEDAVDSGDEDDIERATEDLEDVLDDLENLLEDVEDLRDDINEAEDDDDISKDTEDDLEADLDDLEDDINDLIDEIEDILGIESDDSESAELLEATSTGQSTDSDSTLDNDVDVEVTTFEVDDDGSTATVESTSSFDEIRPLLWLSAGIVIAFALLIFAISMLVTKKR